ncbi:MAG: glycosyltransferase family 1 protein [Bryobacteraceae bacterium]
MKIGIDARFLTHPQCGGFKTYTECLVEALAQVDRTNEYILYLDRPPDHAAAVPNAPNFKVQVVPGSLPLFGFPWREQVRLPRQVARDRLGLLHSPALTAPLHLECASVVTLHDMIWHSPAEYSDRAEKDIRRRLMNWYYRRVPESAVRHAAVILTVSNASKTEIVRQLGLPEDAVVVTHEAAREAFHRYGNSWYLEEGRHRYELPPEFILGIGSSDPRKNIHTLIEAYALLPQSLQKCFSLVILLNHQRFANELRQVSARLGLTDRILFRSVGPSAGEMAKVFNLASLFVFPSLSEGFGLPPLEAMACGTPVIAARNSSIPEVLGDAALLVEAHDAGSLADDMSRLLSDEGLRAQLAERGLKRAASFSWEQCARQTLAAYEHAIGRLPVGQLTSFMSVH